jgi:DNA-binding beta-propeller fold protein YncE
MNFGTTIRLAAVGLFLALLGGCANQPGPETVDPRAPRLTRTIPLPGVGGPADRNAIPGRLDHLAYDPATDRLFLAAFSKGSLEVIDLKQGKLIQTLDGIPEAQGVAVIPGAKRVFVTSGDDGTIHVYDTETLEKKESAFVIEDADNVRFDSRTGQILVGGGSATGGAVVALDPLTLAKVRQTPVPSHAESFRCDPSGPQMYINIPWDKYSDRDGVVVMADRDTGTALASWPLPGIARNFPMALDAAHGRVFVVGRKPATLLAIDTATGTVLGTAPCVPDCDDLFFDAKTNLLLVIAGGRRGSDRAGDPVPQDQPGALDVFAVGDNGLINRIASFPLPPHARTGLLVPERRALYVAVPIQDGEDARIIEYLLPND